MIVKRNLALLNYIQLLRGYYQILILITIKFRVFDVQIIEAE